MIPSFISVAESISPVQVCAETETWAFFHPLLFLNIVHLLHTKETELVKLVILAYMTIRPFPSHDFYNKYTAALGDGSVFRSLGFFYFANSHKVL